MSKTMSLLTVKFITTINFNLRNQTAANVVLLNLEPIKRTNC